MSNDSVWLPVEGMTLLDCVCEECVRYLVVEADGTSVTFGDQDEGEKPSVLLPDGYALCQRHSAPPGGVAVTKDLLLGISAIVVCYHGLRKGHAMPAVSPALVELVEAWLAYWQPRLEDAARHPAPPGGVAEGIQAEAYLLIACARIYAGRVNHLNERQALLTAAQKIEDWLSVAPAQPQPVAPKRSAFDFWDNELDAEYDRIDDVQPQAVAPEPDWTQAPEWAMWWAVDPSGDYVWSESEPFLVEPERATFWMLDTRKRHEQDLDAACLNVRVRIPLGIDWRTLKRQRPANTEPPPAPQMHI